MSEDKIIRVFAAVVVGLLVFIAGYLYNIFTELKAIRSELGKMQDQNQVSSFIDTATRRPNSKP
jgi:hypothetical protein